MFQLHVVPSSENEKVGPCATTYRPVGDSAEGEGTCPSGCPHLKSKECYTFKGKTRLWTGRSSEKYDDPAKMASKLSKYWRWDTAGDNFKRDPMSPKGYSVDMPYVNAKIKACKDNPWATSWGYCHDIMQWVADTGLFPKAGNMPSNFHLLASCEDLEMKAFAIAHGFKTARVINSEDERAKDEIFCPYDRAQYYGKTAKEIKVRCVTCRLCWEAPEGMNIAFLNKSVKKSKKGGR